MLQSYNNEEFTELTHRDGSNSNSKEDGLPYPESTLTRLKSKKRLRSTQTTKYVVASKSVADAKSLV